MDSNGRLCSVRCVRAPAGAGGGGRARWRQGMHCAVGVTAQWLAVPRFIEAARARSVHINTHAHIHKHTHTLAGAHATQLESQPPGHLPWPSAGSHGGIGCATPYTFVYLCATCAVTAPPPPRAARRTLFSCTAAALSARARYRGRRPCRAPGRARTARARAPRRPRRRGRTPARTRGAWGTRERGEVQRERPTGTHLVHSGEQHVRVPPLINLACVGVLSKTVSPYREQEPHRNTHTHTDTCPNTPLRMRPHPRV